MLNLRQRSEFLRASENSAPNFLSSAAGPDQRSFGWLLPIRHWLRLQQNPWQKLGLWSLMCADFTPYRAPSDSKSVNGEKSWRVDSLMTLEPLQSSGCDGLTEHFLNQASYLLDILLPMVNGAIPKCATRRKQGTIEQKHDTNNKPRTYGEPRERS